MKRCRDHRRVGRGFILESLVYILFSSLLVVHFVLLRRDAQGHVRIA
jgi:hypothetical protein